MHAGISEPVCTRSLDYSVEAKVNRRHNGSARQEKKHGHDTHHFVNASTGLRQYVLDEILIPRLAFAYNVPLDVAWSIASKTEKSYTIRGILAIVERSKFDATSLMRRFPRV